MNSAPARGKPTGQEESNSWGCSDVGLEGPVSPRFLLGQQREAVAGALSPAVAQALHREGFRRSCATRDGNFAPGSFSKGLKHILCIQRSQDGDTVQLFLVT